MEELNIREAKNRRKAHEQEGADSLRKSAQRRKFGSSVP